MSERMKFYEKEMRDLKIHINNIKYNISKYIKIFWILTFLIFIWNLIQKLCWTFFYIYYLTYPINNISFIWWKLNFNIIRVLFYFEYINENPVTLVIDLIYSCRHFCWVQCPGFTMDFDSHSRLVQAILCAISLIL